MERFAGWWSYVGTWIGDVEPVSAFVFRYILNFEDEIILRGVECNIPLFYVAMQYLLTLMCARLRLGAILEFELEEYLRTLGPKILICFKLLLSRFWRKYLLSSLSRKIGSHLSQIHLPLVFSPSSKHLCEVWVVLDGKQQRVLDASFINLIAT
jgi:hypothetical protein